MITLVALVKFSSPEFCYYHSLAAVRGSPFDFLGVGREGGNFEKKDPAVHAYFYQNKIIQTTSAKRKRPKERTF